MKQKEELPFPNPKLERQAISVINKIKIDYLKNKLKIFSDSIDILYNIRYEALVWYNGCEKITAYNEFMRIVDRAEKAILKLMWGFMLCVL